MLSLALCWSWPSIACVTQQISAALSVLRTACLQSLFACGKRCLDQGDSRGRVTCAIGIKIPVDLTSASALHINILIIDKSMIRREWKGTINGKGQRNGEEGRTAKQKYCL